MADHFAVIDVGSNAIRWQIAAVDHPKHYRILAQERRPVRLGREVFQTGRLSPKSAEAALKALGEFKAVADRYRAKGIRAVGTSAMREASDRRSFLKRAHALGVPLEVLPEEQEARLISLGIMSGLHFHLPLGLFLDIGGGSVEMTVADPTNTFCLFSLALGAVRLTVHRTNAHIYAQITTAAGDIAQFRSLGSGNVVCEWYSKAGIVPQAAGGPSVIVRDQKTSGTDGGTFTSGADRTRDLTTLVLNVGSIASLGSNQITLPAGTYYFEWDTQAKACDSHVSLIYNVTDSAEVGRGCTAESSSATSRQNLATGVATVTITGNFHAVANCSGKIINKGKVIFRIAIHQQVDLRKFFDFLSEALQWIQYTVIGAYGMQHLF